jgi:hypothetical protein
MFSRAARITTVEEPQKGSETAASGIVEKVEFFSEPTLENAIFNLAIKNCSIARDTTQIFHLFHYSTGYDLGGYNKNGWALRTREAGCDSGSAQPARGERLFAFRHGE